MNSMTSVAYLEHVTQWLVLRRNMSRAAAEQLVRENAAYLEGAWSRDIDSIRAASYVHALADI